MYIDDINRRVLFPTHEELEETLSIVNALSDDQKMESRKSIKPINRALRVFVRDDWHAAFESVLRARGKVNTILTEYELGVEPDRVDFLVLILDEGVDFDGPAFRHFRKFNILEYKGGTDRVTEEVVRKTVAYGNNYCCLPGNKGVSRDTTLTILFETMSQFASGDELRETGTAGVYTLGRYTDLSLYVIILGELEGKDYAAYRAISARPQKEYFRTETSLLLRG